MLSIEELMRDLAAYLQTELGYENEVYSLVVPLTNGRHQEVGATIRLGDDGRQILDFVSAVGPVHSGLDPWHLLQLNGQASFSRITVARQMIFVVASQLLATAQAEEVLVMLREVANFADTLERQFFQTDQF